MKIGILTFFRVANFGANLQAISTYCYLKNHGHEPIIILYESKKTYSLVEGKGLSEQQKMHFRCVDSIVRRTERCYNVDEINSVIKKEGIESLIIGSDAVLQHHPLICRIKAGKRKPFYILPKAPERVFPNPFWGYGISDIPMSMMSVSSQNSEFQYFSKGMKSRMNECLSRMRYISVRDSWTKNMLCSISNTYENVAITPDPVFSFNQNSGYLVEEEQRFRDKFKLEREYVLISLNGQSMSYPFLQQLKIRFQEMGKECVAFPLPRGVIFNHPFNQEVQLPLSPLDWYAMLKYSSGYIGTNMHPIVVCLHNAIPCFSIDSWGTTTFLGKHRNDNSSKVQHILSRFGLSNNRAPVDGGCCNVSVDAVMEGIINYPTVEIETIAKELQNEYNEMMSQLLTSLSA